VRVRKDVREFIRRLEGAGLTVEPTPGHENLLHEGLQPGTHTIELHRRRDEAFAVVRAADEVKVVAVRS
jgi:hypothetical protein